MRNDSRKYKMLGLFFAPLIIIVGLYMLFSNKNEVVPIEITESEVRIPVIDDTKKITRNTRDIEIEVRYPVINNLSPNALSRINTDIEMVATRMVSEFEERSITTTSSFVSSLEVTHDPLTYSHTVLSVPLLVSEYASGSAHPMSYKTVLHYDTETGLPMTLASLFTEGSAYLSVLSVQARASLDALFTKNEWEQSSWLDEGTAPIADNYKEWYLQDDTFYVVFNPYQVAPYVYGIIEAPIPLSKLSSVLLPLYK